jgi:histidyl-tRNA synthetase
MAEKFQAPRGTRDLLPGEIELWQWAEARAREVLERYGYREIRTPLFEDYELFARTSGEASEVVQKEMYRFRDLGDRDLALRPEFTASVCRAYLEHGLGGRSRVHKLWSLGPVFRYGRPQKGRYRQFSQINAETLGSSAPAADVEMIALFVDIFEAWGFRRLAVVVNSLGTPAVRRAYGEALRAWLEPAARDLSADSRRRLETNPLRVLDTKDPADLEILAGRRAYLGPMPRLLDHLDPGSRAHWDQVLAGLAALGLAYEVDHGLVRGLDYYTHTAFEVHDRSLGAQSALGGGGRYDGLIEALGGPPTPGVGFAIGLDRSVLVLAQRGVSAPPRPPLVYVAAMESTRAAALVLARELRRAFAVECDAEGRSVGAQLKAADKAGARVVVLVGEEEWGRGEVAVKDLENGSQRALPRAGLEEALQRLLREKRETQER